MSFFKDPRQRTPQSPQATVKPHQPSTASTEEAVIPLTDLIAMIAITGCQDVNLYRDPSIRAAILRCQALLEVKPRRLRLEEE